MVDFFEASSNNFRVLRDDQVAFDTALPSLQLFPDSKINLSGIAINFPNMLSSIVYKHQGGGSLAFACESWSGLLPQEWGPNYSDFSPTGTQYLNNQSSPPRRNLPRSLLGTVPIGTDFIDVRAKLTRTINPPSFKRISPPLVMFPENEWIHLVSGSCTCEFFAPLIRHFDILLIGTNVYLDRYQSSRNFGQISSTTGGDENGRTATQIGAAWGNYANAPAEWAYDCVFFEQRGPDGNGNHRPPWGTTSINSCTAGSVVNYQSQYSADFIITPGRYNS